MNSLEAARPGVTIGFALPSTNRGNKRKENSSDFGVITTRGKTNSATRLVYRYFQELHTHVVTLVDDFI